MQNSVLIKTQNSFEYVLESRQDLTQGLESVKFITEQNMALEILKKLIQYPTITPLEHGIYEYIQTLLPSFKAFSTPG